MILQNILFPNGNICCDSKLYFKGNSEIDYVNSVVRMKENDYIKSDTYFNGFSYGKWNLYTSVSDLHLTLLMSGKIEVRLFFSKLKNNRVENNIVKYIDFDSNEKKELKIDIPIIDDATMVFFHLTSITSSCFFGGYYSCDNEFNNSFKLAINLCTYRREEYIKRTVKSIYINIISDNSIDYCDNIDIYIVDNGSTLEKSDFPKKHILFFKQNDYGASGGFTRGLIEMLNSRITYDYVLFIDDDVILDPEVVKRTYVFMSLLKNHYKDSILGGAFLKITEPYRQVESGGIWNNGSPIAPNKNLNMRAIESLLRNEIINPSVNYHPWFYCCMPFSKVSENNLPMPMFMKRDDIEYCLRFGSNFIQLNGICVWHEGYEFKYNSVLLYYIIRSTPMVNAIHGITYSKEQYKKHLKNIFMNAVFSYNYPLTDIILKGVEDFLGGVDKMKQIHEPENFEKLLAHNKKKLSIIDIKIPFREELYAKTLLKPRHPFTRWRKITLNGALLPAKLGTVYAPETGQSPHFFYRAKKIYTVDLYQQRAFITKKNILKTISAFIKLKNTLKQIDKKYDDATKSFSKRYFEISNIQFWKRYLNME